MDGDAASKREDSLKRDDERIRRIQDCLEANNWDALVCSLPMNVLLLTGYWPVVGTSVAIALRGRICVIVPEDEEELARQGWADEVITFHPGALDKITTAAQALHDPFQGVTKELSSRQCRIGLEQGETTEPASYAAIHLYGRAIQQLLEQTLPSFVLDSADDVLAQLRSVKTADETVRIRTACKLAERAFREGASQLCAGMTELEVANLYRGSLSTGLPDFPDIERADGFVFCMSGPNSALAGSAYARSRTRRIEAGDLVLIHCNSYADGHWTDITRTFSIGEPDIRGRAIREAVFAAREAALGALAPGVPAAHIDVAARTELRARGFGPQFTHSTGHGIGFSAIDGNAQPRLHPKSPDTIQAGMVFNIEPAVYIKKFGGIRHCDMVAVSDTGAELLTDFQCHPEELVLNAG